MEEKKEETYDEYYSVKVCPYCNHKKCVEVKKSFFDWDTQYECSKCSRKFDMPNWLDVVPKKAVTDIVNKGLSGKITQEEMKKAFDKIGVWIQIPFKPRKKK